MGNWSKILSLMFVRCLVNEPSDSNRDVSNILPLPMPMKLTRIFWMIGFATVSFGVWAMLAPIQVDSREMVYEIPLGTWEKRAAGNNEVEIFPSEIRLVLGVKDILVLKNLDKVPQLFGPTLIMPGQSFTMPFKRALDYQFQCSAHTTEQLTVIVDPEPTIGWPRLVWRLKSLVQF